MQISSPTPREIDDHVIQLVERILPGATPIYVNVIPEPQAEINGCFLAVEKKVRDSGGSMLIGWQIWKMNTFLIEANFHAIWHSPSGEIIDITPKRIPDSKTLFLPDAMARYDGIQRDNIRQSLIKNELVDHYIAMAECQFYLLNRNERAKQYGRIKLVGEEAELYSVVDVIKNHLEKMLRNHQTINSPCFCGGNKTYIHCHQEKILKALEKIKEKLI